MQHHWRPWHRKLCHALTELDPVGRGPSGGLFGGGGGGGTTKLTTLGRHITLAFGGRSDVTLVEETLGLKVETELLPWVFLGIPFRGGSRVIAGPGATPQRRRFSCSFAAVCCVQLWPQSS